MGHHLPPIVCFSTEDWDTALPTNKKQLMSRLASPQSPVLWIDTVGTRWPRPTPSDLRRVARRLLPQPESSDKAMPPGLIRLSPRVIPGGPPAANRALLGRNLRRVMRANGISHYILWVYNPYAVDYLEALPAPPRLIVYHCVDDLSRVPGARGNAIRKAELRLIERADIVFCTSPALMERCGKQSRHGVFAPNVADFEHFNRAAQPNAEPPPGIAAIPRPRIIFAGNLVDYKIDFTLVGACARSRPDWQFVIIGPEWTGNPKDALAALRALPNAHFPGPAPYDTLPEWLAGADVLMMPYRLCVDTETIFPLKFFEFLSTGKPVVSTALPALSSHAGVIPLVTGAEEFTAAIDDALRGRQSSGREARLALARQNTWDIRLKGMITEINALLAAKSPD